MALLGDKVGNVYYEAHIIGDKLPSEARRIGRDAGTVMGEESSKSFEKEMGQSAQRLRKVMLKEGRFNGINFGNALRGALLSQRADLTNTLADIFSDKRHFEEFVNNAHSVTEGLDEIRLMARKLHDEKGMRFDTWRVLNREIDEWGEGLLENERKAQKFAQGAREISEEVERLNTILSTDSGWREFRDGMDSNAHATSNLRTRLEELNRTNNISVRDFHTMSDSLDKLELNLNKSTEATEKHNKSVAKTGHHWKNLPHNGRQAILITAAVAAGFESLAGLASGLSASLVAVGSSLLYAGASAIPFAAVLPNLIYGFSLANHSLEIFKERGGAAAKALQRLKDSVSKVDAGAFAREWESAFTRFSNALAKSLEEDRIGEMTGKAFAKFTDAFTNVIESPQWAAFRTAMETSLPNALAAFGTGSASVLQGLLSVLEAAAPFTERMADAFARWAEDWAKAMDLANKDGSLASFFEKAFEAAEKLWGVFKPFKDALGNVFAIGVDSGNRLLDTFGKLARRFEGFTQSFEGKNKLEEWFKNGEKVMDGVLYLLGKVGKLFGNLVTPEAIDRVDRLLRNLGDSMPFFESIGRVLGELDVFGLVAQVFNDIGNALVPVLDLLEPLADIINMLVSNSISQLAFAINLLTPLLAPLELGFRLWAHVIERLQEHFKPFTDALFGSTESLDGLALEIYEGVLPAFDEMLTAFLDLLPEPEEMARILEEEVIPAIEDFAKWIVDEAIPALSDFYTWIKDDVVPVIGDLWAGFQTAMGVIEAFASTTRRVLGPVIAILSTMWQLLMNILGVKPKAVAAAGTGLPGVRGATATGGVFAGAQTRLIAEAGPEAVVPLHRPLSQVDPAVRELSAFAQGLHTGSSGGPSKVITIAEGAFQVITPAKDPVIVTSMVMEAVITEAFS